MNQRLKREFDLLNAEHWDGKLPSIEIRGSRSIEDMGMYWWPEHPLEDIPETYRILINLNHSREVQRKTLLHEMCHHAVFLDNKYLFMADEGLIWWHGKEWRKEMRRVGFKGRITQYT